MTTVRAFASRLFGLLTRRRRDIDLHDEIQTHLDCLAHEHLRRGMSPAEARLAARREFGAVDQMKETYRDQRGLRFVDSFIQDTRYALRTLRRSPSFTAVAVAILAVGIGVNTTVFTVANATLFKGFPLVHRNDRLLYVTTNRWCCVSYPDFEDWRAQAKSFEGMALVRGVGITFSDQSGLPERFAVTEVTADTFRLVGQQPIIGRDFAPADETPGATPVAILSYGFWERRYGRDPTILDRTVRLNGIPTIVIGVMPRGFSFPQNQDLWVPLMPTPDVLKRENRSTWFVVGRVADGVSIESARAEIETIGKRLERVYPVTEKGFPPEVRNFREFFIGSNATLIYTVMWGAVGVVLLIACANLANLLLARANGRSREMSIRIALGAGRWRIIRQLLIESVVFSGLGGVVAWWLARWSVRLYALAANGAGISNETGSWFDRMLDYSMDYRVLAYLVAISIGTALLFGLAPVSRLSTLDVNATLKDGGRGAIGQGRRRHLAAVLVIGEMALGVVLLAGAGVLIRSFLSIYHADMGVNTANVLTMFLSLPDVKYPGPEAQISFFERLTTRLTAIPGVESIVIASTLPTGTSLTVPYQLAGAPPVEEQRRPRVPVLVIGPAYFRILGAAVLSGREFNDADGASGVPVVIVNQRFARQFWPGENPLGKRLRLFTGNVALLGGGHSTVSGQVPEAWLTVVGVVSNIVQNDRTRQEFQPLVYLPYPQRPAASMSVLARTRLPSEGLETAFRRAIQALDSDLPIFDLVTLTERLESGYAFNRSLAMLFVMFAAIALLLASFGLYAVIAHSVSQRTQEIGVRMAIGATPRDVLTLVFREGLLPVGMGLTIGLAAALAVTPLLKSQLVHVSPADPVTYAVATTVLVLSAALGCWIPARRATRVDPVVALRHD